MGRLDNNDILRIAAAHTAAEGRSVPGVGTTLFAGGTDAGRSMVDEHERLHTELNGCSSFGLLLSAVGAGAVPLSDTSRAQMLEHLIGLCRRTHEIYATTLSLSQQPRNHRHAALADYPGYLEFLDDGEVLANGIALESPLGAAFVVAACVAAMQVPLNLILGGSPDWHRELPRAAPGLTPDRRLDQIIDAVAGGQVDGSRVATDFPSTFLNQRSDDPYGTPAFKDYWHRALIRVYQQHGYVLARGGSPTLPWDGHLWYFRRIPLHAPVDVGGFGTANLSPQEIDRMARETMKVSNRLHVVRTSESQVLERPALGTAVAMADLASVLRGEVPGLNLRAFAHTAPHTGLHVIVRPVEGVIASYSTSAEQDSYLRSVAEGGVLTALRAVGEVGDRLITAIAILTSTHELENLVAAVAADPAVRPVVVATVSLSCLFARDWRNTWLTPLRYVAHPVLLADLRASDFLQIDFGSDGINYVGLRLGSTQLPSGRSDELRGVVVERNRAENKVDRFTAFLGSDGLVRNLLERLGDLPGAQPGRSELDPPVMLALSHVSLEEPSFHFDGLQYIPDPSPLEEPDLPPEAFERWYALHRRLADHASEWFRFASTRNE